MSRPKTALLALTLVVSGCAARPVTDSFCAVARPIAPTAADVECISDRLVEDILNHNDTYRSLCP